MKLTDRMVAEGTAIRKSKAPKRRSRPRKVVDERPQILPDPALPAPPPRDSQEVAEFFDLPEDYCFEIDPNKRHLRINALAQVMAEERGVQFWYDLPLEQRERWLKLAEFALACLSGLKIADACRRISTRRMRPIIAAMDPLTPEDVAEIEQAFLAA